MLAAATANRSGVELTTALHALAKTAAHRPDNPTLAKAITCMQNGNGSRFLAYVRQKKVHHQLADLPRDQLTHIGLLAAYNNCPEALAWFLKHTHMDPADSLLFYVLANPDRSHFLRLSLQSPNISLADDRVEQAFVRALYAKRDDAIEVFMDFPTARLMHLAFRSSLFLESIGDEPLVDIPEVCAKLLEFTCTQCPEPIPTPPCSTLPLFPQLPPKRSSRARLTCMPKPVLRRIAQYLDAHSAYALRHTCTKLYKRLPVDHLVPDRFLLLAYTIFHRDFEAPPSDTHGSDSDESDHYNAHSEDSDDDGGLFDVGDDDDEVWESIHDALHTLSLHPRVMRSTPLRTLALILAVREGLWTLASDILSGVESGRSLTSSSASRSVSRSRCRAPVTARLDPAVYIWAVCTELGLLSPSNTCGNHDCCAHVCDPSCPAYRATPTCIKSGAGASDNKAALSSDADSHPHTHSHHHLRAPVTQPALHTLSLLVRGLGTRCWLFLHHPDFPRLLAQLPPEPSVDSDRALVFSVLVPLVRGQLDLVVQRLKSLPPELVATAHVDEGAVRNITCAAIRLGAVAPVACLIDHLKVAPWHVPLYGHAHLCRLAAASGSKAMHDMVAKWLGTDGPVPPYMPPGGAAGSGAAGGVKSAVAQRLRAGLDPRNKLRADCVDPVGGGDAPPPHRECIIAAKLNGHDDLAMHILRQCGYPVDDPRIAAFFCPCCVAESLDGDAATSIKQGLAAVAAAALQSSCGKSAGIKANNASGAADMAKQQQQQQQSKSKTGMAGAKTRASGAAIS